MKYVLTVLITIIVTGLLAGLVVRLTGATASASCSSIKDKTLFNVGENVMALDTQNRVCFYNFLTATWAEIDKVKLQEALKNPPAAPTQQ